MPALSSMAGKASGQRCESEIAGGDRMTLGGMRLSKDKTILRVNPSLTLAGIPPETFAYRLGNRSALEWVIDQYQVMQVKRSSIRSDLNRADDEEYIGRLVGQVVRVSLKQCRAWRACQSGTQTERAVM